MALVERRRRGGLATVPVLAEAGVKIAPSLYQAFRQWYDNSNQTSTSSSFPSTNGGKQSGRQKRQNRQRRQASGNGSDQSPKFVMTKGVKGGSADNVRVSLKDVVSPVSATAGVAAYTYPLGIVSTSSFFTLGGIMTRLTNFGAIYRQFKINRLVVKWMPNQAYTSSGVVALGIDTFPTPLTPGNFGAVLHHNPSFLTDIKAPAQFVWVPNAKEEPRFTSTVGTDEDEVSYGQLQMYCTTSVTGGPPGLLLWEVDVTFMGPI